MKTVVLIKQVPMVSEMTLDPETKTLRREGVRSEVSSFDIRALLKAVELREEGGGEVVAMTLGPPQASDALRHCLALGADRGVHITDRAFAGSDTLATARALGLALKREGYEVMEACDGKDGLSKLTGQKVHLIISDVNMPNMDGITLVREVKKLPSYKFTPIIMLTTESESTKKEEGKAAGAKAWIVKPFKPDQMAVAVSRLVGP